MRRFLPFLLLFLLACNFLVAPLPAGTPLPAPTDSPGFTVRIHPDGPLYVGDQISIEVLAPSQFDPSGKSVRVELNDQNLGIEDFQPFGISRRSQATFFWVLDTANLNEGAHTLRFSLLPDQQTWTETISLRPAGENPYPEPETRWETLTTECCIVYYITETAAARDIETLAGMLETQADDVEKRFGVELNNRIPVTFLPRVLGHGGFASDGIYVSYLDRNYAGNATTEVIHHEMVHWADSQLGGQFKPSILQEGLAVYMTDGHFKIEPILPRAAALLELGWYIPLQELADSFYTSQHEIGYLQAAALVAYLVDSYGYERFNTFYRNINAADSHSPSKALDLAWRQHFGTSFEQMEAGFIAYLQAQPYTTTDRSDIYLTVAFYDTVRRYQQAHDPSAYFLTAWLPDINEMRRRDIVADLLRHPDSPINVQVENLLTATDAALRAGNYSLAETNLRATNALLDMLGKAGAPAPNFLLRPSHNWRGASLE